MLANSENVQNRTNSKSVALLGQIRLSETESGIEIKHFVTERERLYGEYANFAIKTAQSTVEMCRVVKEAKTTLSKEDYKSFLNDIGHKSEDSTIRKYLAIGERYETFVQYTNLLPNSWTSIYTLTQLPSETFDALALTETDMSKMSGKEIQSLIDLNKQTTASTSSSTANSSNLKSASLSSNSATTDIVNESDVESDKDANANANANEVVSADTVNQQEIDCVARSNSEIDVVSKDDTYEVLVRFTKKPTDDQWFDLTEHIDFFIHDVNQSLEMITTRPLFKRD